MINSWSLLINFIALAILSIVLAGCSPTEEQDYWDKSLYFLHYKEFHTIWEKGEKTHDKPGEAIGVFDVNRDGLDDIVILNSTQSYFVLMNSRAADGRHDFKMRSYRVADVKDGKHRLAKTLGMHDFNDDGYLDLHLGTMGKGTERTAWRPSKAGLRRSGDYSTQINQRDGTFAYQDLGANGVGSKRAIVFADFDGDSHFDAYINTSPYYGPWYLGSPAPAQLYPGIGSDGRFGPDMLDQMLINAPEDFWHDKDGNGTINFKGAVARDFDNDGKPDLVSGAMSDIRAAPDNTKTTPADGPAYQGDWYRGIFIFRNVSQPGQIRFEDVSNTAIENAYGRTDQMHVKTIFPVDLNSDGLLDLVVGGPHGGMFSGSVEHATDTLRVYRNESSPGKVKFVDITKESGLAFINVTNHSDAYPHLVGQNGIPRFSHLSAPTNLIAIDLDNDADNDIVVLRYNMGEEKDSHLLRAHSWIFLNDGMARFTPVGPAFTGMKAGGKHMTFGDLNDDGRMDIIATKPDQYAIMAGGNHVYLNTHNNDNNYIKIDITAKSNKLGIGTKVTVFESGTEHLIGYDEVRTDFGYRSNKSTTLHFGLGTNKKVDVLLVGRDGRSSIHRNLAVNTKHSLSFP